MNLKRIKHSLKEKVGIQIRRKTLAAGVGYTTSNLLLKGVAFLSIPIFTRLLTPADFGLYSVFVSYESILFLFVGLCLRNAFF